MPRITSTSCITGTGFMKCMPITRSGLLVAAPSERDRDRTTCWSRGSSRAPCFRRAAGRGRASSRSASVAASIASATSRSRKCGRASMCSRTRRALERRHAALLDVAIELLRDPVDAAFDADLIDVVEQHLVPVLANTCAMPAPICPAPTTINRMRIRLRRRARAARRLDRRRCRSTRCRDRRRGGAAGCTTDATMRAPEAPIG